MTWSLKDDTRKELEPEPEKIHVTERKPGLKDNLPARVRDRAITFSESNFVVNGRKMKLLSGAIHYFRVVPDYWEDRLQRLKAAGLNTVETSVGVIVYM